MAIATFLILLLPITIFAYGKDFGHGETWYRYFLSYSVAFIGLFIFSIKRYKNNVLGFLGTISYSIYLMHGIIFDVAFRYFSKTNINQYLLNFIVFTLVLVISIIIYYFIEKPCVKLGRKVHELYFKQRSYENKSA